MYKAKMLGVIFLAFIILVSPLSCTPSSTSGTAKSNFGDTILNSAVLQEKIKQELSMVSPEFTSFDFREKRLL